MHGIKASVKPGLEAFLEKHLDLIRSKKIGLITNPSGVNRRLISTIDLFFRNPEIDLCCLFEAEHGIQGTRQAGEPAASREDPKHGIPVISLYAQSPDRLSDATPDRDQRMRYFDTIVQGKKPDRDAVRKIDVMIFDIQDTGTRVYTYMATMAYAMEVCAENEVPFIVLDRPNPLNGLIMEGPVLDYPGYSSFVGLYPVPMRHAMTAGELALYINKRFLEKKAVLTVIPMEGWQREMWFDQTDLFWIPPSPNMPTLATATVYPGQVCLEGTNLSEGRGTTRPFELFGAPWLRNMEMIRRLKNAVLPGVLFREACFAPEFSKYRGEPCSGAQVHVVDREEYKPFLTTMEIIRIVKNLHPEKFFFHGDYFDKIVGNPRIRKVLEDGREFRALQQEFVSGLKNFASERKPFLLY